MAAFEAHDYTWWRWYGSKYPTIAKAGMKLTSLTCSSTAAEGNWSQRSRHSTESRSSDLIEQEITVTAFKATKIRAERPIFKKRIPYGENVLIKMLDAIQVDNAHLSQLPNISQIRKRIL